jgi:glycosyltransferase involved in cell wall biosynthesis
MKIAIITGPFGCLPPAGVGAVEKIWAAIAEEFARDGHSVTLLSKAAREKTPLAESGPVRVVALPGYERTGSLYRDVVLDLWYSMRALWRMPPCDVVVLNTFWSPLLCVLARHKIRRSVYNVQRFPKGLYWLFGAAVDRLACVSHAVGDELIRQSPARKSQVKVIGNRFDPIVFGYRPTVDSQPPRRICYTGRVHPEKGIEILVRAFVDLRAKYPDLQLCVVGPRSIAEGGGGDGYVARLEALAGAAVIDWVDPIADPGALADQIAASDIYCYPSIAEKGEAFGVAPLEAMALGRPVVVSALECFEDFVKHETTGLVFDHRAADSHVSLAANIERLLLDASLVSRLSAQGSEFAHNRFSLAAVSRQYIEDFSELIAGG